jgi:4-hydroxybenzoyl-CoA thioesterase
MAKLVNRRQFAIEWNHCDPVGMVISSRFFEFFDLGTWGLFETALGFKPRELREKLDIFGIPLVDAGANFVAPVQFGDEVELQSHMAEFRRSSFDVAHRLIRRDGTVLVEGSETRVWAIRDPGDPNKIKAQPIPDAIMARFDVA